MKPERLTIHGRITEKGQIKIANKAEVLDFYNANKNKTIILSGGVYEQKESSKLLVAYYWKVVLPAIQQAIYELHGERLKLSEVDEKLRAESAYMELVEYDENDNPEEPKTYTVYNAGNNRLRYFIEECKMKAAFHYSRYIDDPAPKV